MIGIFGFYRMACPVRVVGIESPGIESLLQGPIPFLSGFIWLAGWLLDPLAHTSQYSPPTHTDWLAIWVLLDLMSNTPLQNTQAGNPGRQAPPNPTPPFVVEDQRSSRRRAGW